MSTSEDDIDHVGGITLNKVTMGYGSINFPDTASLTTLEELLFCPKEVQTCTRQDQKRLSMCVAVARNI